jgi:uncharacterized membrane protein YagU involved in acid resistance
MVLPVVVVAVVVRVDLSEGAVIGCAAPFAACAVSIPLAVAVATWACGDHLPSRSWRARIFIQSRVRPNPRMRAVAGSM